VYFNLRNILLKSGTFLLGHPVYVLYANEIFCYICFIDKTRSRLQNDDLNLQI